MKLNRSYRLTIEVNNNESIVIEPPFTLDFNVQRSVSASVNSATFSIYNLAPKTRRRIFKDWFDFTNYRSITLEAGYGDQLSTIFKGDVWQAQSARNGSDVVTTVTARDGGWDTRRTQTSATVQKGTTLKDLLGSLTQQFPNLSQGNIGGQDSTFQRPIVLEGNTYELMKKYTDDRVFVDLETVNVLDFDEAFEAAVPLINSQTGLLGTPQKQEAFVTIETLFEPRIVMGQIVEVESSIQPEYDGQYKVMSVQHSGTISEAVGGNAQSVFKFFSGGSATNGITVI